MALEGLHHITAITGDAPANVAFYTRVLGLRMVKKTVNFDAPDVYHLYYGDERGTPGSLLTFFEFPGARQGRAGGGGGRRGRRRPVRLPAGRRHRPGAFGAVDRRCGRVEQWDVAPDGGVGPRGGVWLGHVAQIGR